MESSGSSLYLQKPSAGPWVMWIQPHPACYFSYPFHTPWLPGEEYRSWRFSSGSYFPLVSNIPLDESNKLSSFHQNVLTVPENCVYALGGFDSTNYQASVERFDPRMGRWCPVPSMSSRRSSCGVAPLDGALYCIGGNDGTMCMSSGERFNIRRNAWEPISAMHSRR